MRHAGFIVASLGPILLLYIVFRAIPLVMTLPLSLFDYNIIKANPAFVGLANYRAVLTEPLSTISFTNTFKWVLMTIPLNLVVTLPVAMAINGTPRFKTFFRSAYFAPVITSLVAVSLVWRYLFDSTNGLINSALTGLGLPGPNWLTDPRLALLSCAIAFIWQDMGYNTVIFLAGLQGIPEMYYEAARVDGASAWHLFRNITIPLLRPTILFVLVTTTISYFQVFVPMRVMTNGGPLYATRVVALHIYESAFAELRMGYATAMGMLLFLILFLLALFQFVFLRQTWEY